MTQLVINVGTAPNDGLGDPIRTAYQKCNTNFSELYSRVQTSIPPTLVGSVGDTAGMYAYDSNYFYYCYANYTGNSTIWGQVADSVSTYGNANVVTLLSAYGSNNISTTGNITGNYILGNGALLTGVSATVVNLINGNSNVDIVSSGGNVTVGVGGSANVVIFSPAGEYVTGVVSATGNITGSSILAGGLITATGTVTGGNIRTVGYISTTGNIIGGNVINSGLSSVTGNVTGGNILTAGIMSSTGDATHGNILTAGLISATGSVQAGNLRTAGIVSATANVIGNNINATTTIKLSVFANATVRDSAISSPVTGMMVYVTGTGMQVRGATSWNTVAGTGT